jgi:trimethylamine:corrinoid methyltransferase-like protein
MAKNKPLLKVELLSKGDIDRIHEMSLRILDQVGVTVPHPEMLGAAAGADIFGHMGISGVDQASSLDILVMQHEVIDYVESVLRQISFSEEDFAVEEILNAGRAGISSTAFIRRSISAAVCGFLSR